MSLIILASQSPRRKELLAKMGVDFTIFTSQYDEKLDESRGADEVAKELALGKAMDVAKDHPDAYVIGSDTVVAINGRQMEKPKDIEEAREMLIALSKDVSSVSTGIAVVNLSKNIQISDVATTIVHFKQDSPEVTKFREEYLASGDWHDKAGAYGIQSGAAPIIECISGDYDVIVGLPTRKLSQILSNLGIDSHPVVEQSPVIII